MTENEKVILVGICFLIAIVLIQIINWFSKFF